MYGFDIILVPLVIVFSCYAKNGELKLHHINKSTYAQCKTYSAETSSNNFVQCLCDYDAGGFMEMVNYNSLYIICMYLCICLYMKG